MNKANPSVTEDPFLDLDLSITNGIVSTKIYDKRDVFNFEIVNFPFFDGDVPRSPTLLQQGISEPVFYGNLVYKFTRMQSKG